MRRPSWFARAAAVAAVLVTLTVATPASATVVVSFTRAQLVQRADFVVRATVVSQQSLWNEDNTQIITLTRLRVASYLRGAGPQELVLRQFGGQVDGMASHVPGDARFAQGQDVVLFLRRGPGVVYLTALAQSAYFVERNARGALSVRRDLSELTFATPQNGQYVMVEPGAEPTETLEHLLAEIASLAGGAR